MIQLNYRYASPEYIAATLPGIKNPGYQDGISQVGTTASWPIADRWAVVGACHYDTRAKQTAKTSWSVCVTTPAAGQLTWAMNVKSLIGIT